MSRFVVRIELRDSESADYDELHEKLASHGFKEPFLTLITIPYGFRTQSIYTKQKQTVFIMLDIWPKLFLKNQA